MNDMTTPAAADSAKKPRRRAKGEQTREKIIEAVLQVIADSGVRAVTHRAVAAQADVPVSLITYYFKDIRALISEAFAGFSARSRPGMDELWHKIDQYLGRFSPDELRAADKRAQVCRYLAGIASAYVIAQVRDHAVGLAVEQSFFSEARLSPELRGLAQAHRGQLLMPLREFCSRFNVDDPELDAELLLDAITSVEYQALASTTKQLDGVLVERLLRRQLGWIMGLERA